MKALLCVVQLWALFSQSSQQSDNTSSISALPTPPSQNGSTNETASALIMDMNSTTVPPNPPPTITSSRTTAIPPIPVTIIISVSPTQLLPNSTRSLATSSQTSLSTTRPLHSTNANGIISEPATTNLLAAQTTVASSTLSIPPNSLISSLKDGFTSTSLLSSQSSKPSPSPTDTSSTTAIEFVREHPIAFTLIGVSFVFVSCMCCCLCCALIFRRQRKKKLIRRDTILQKAGDVWIINPGATLRSDSPDNQYETQPVQPARHVAAANALQTSQDDALVIANHLEADLSPPPQYYDLSQHSSTTHLLPMQPAQNVQPSAPPIDNKNF